MRAAKTSVGGMVETLERRTLLCGATSAGAQLAQPALISDGLPPLDGGVGEDNPVVGTVNGTVGNDVLLVTGTGDDVQVVLNGVAQALPASLDELQIDLGSGDDKLVVEATVTVRILATGSGGKDTLQGGGAGDELSGANGKDRVLGGPGDDYLLGGAANDYLNGQGGNDTCSGAGGKDRIYGGLASEGETAGADSMLGGNGNDYFFSEADGLVDSMSGGLGTDIAAGVEASIDIVASVEASV
jgi:Ca2+-binding RTX toxin-like protein